MSQSAVPGSAVLGIAPGAPFMLDIDRMPPELEALTKDLACGTCGKVFKAGTSYGWVCPQGDCPVQPKAR